MVFQRNVYPSKKPTLGEVSRELSEEDKALNTLSTTLKPFVLEVVERAFREYARKHNAPHDMEQTEWERFKRILNKHL